MFNNASVIIVANPDVVAKLMMMTAAISVTKSTVTAPFLSTEKSISCCFISLKLIITHHYTFTTSQDYPV